MAEDIRKLARLLAEHDRRLRNLAASSQLANSSIEDGSLDEYDADGNLGTSLGKQHDGTHNVISHTGPVPPQPVAPTATVTAGVMSVRWNGKFAGDALSPMDFMHCSVHVSATSPFVASIDNQKATISGETGDLATITVAPGAWYVCLVAKSLSGKWSAQSATIPVTVPVPADSDAIGEALDDLNVKTDGLITESGLLGGRLTQAETDLTAHESRLDTNDTTLNTLQNTTLPQLQTDLDAAKTDLNTLENTTLPALQADVNAAEASLNTLNSTTLPALQSDVDAAEASLNTLNNTTLPAMQAEVNQAQADLTTAFGQISTAQTTADNAQTTADNAQTAAANAQTAADNANATADQIWSTVKRSFFWAGDTLDGVFTSTNANASIVNVPDAPASSSVLRKDGIGGSFYWDANPMPFDPEALYKITFKVRVVTAATSPANPVFYAGVHAWNANASGGPGDRISNAGTVSTSSAHYFAAGSEPQPPVGQWTTVVGYFQGLAATGVSGGGEHQNITNPGQMVEGTKYISPMALVDYSSGNGTWDVGMVAIDVVPAELQAQVVAAQSAADAAQSTANAAQTAAGTAQAAADGAMTMATSKSRVYYSTSVATGTAEKAGDLWRQRNGTYEVIAEWMWTGSAWQKVTVSGSNVSNMDVGYLTSGGALIQTAVIQKIAAQAATIIELNADRIIAGQLGAARINVTELAASIATVIQLNADRIVSGTIATARLNATEVAAAVATVINLNASRITSGTVNTARLNASEIAAAVATIIQLNADRIVSGTISTARLNVTDIAAQTAAIQTVDVKNLFVTTGTISEAVINKLFADVVMSRKIATQMLAVGDFNNMAAISLEPGGTKATGWAAGLIVDTADCPAGTPFAVKSTAGQGTYSPPTPYDYFDVAPGDEILFSMWLKASVTGTRYYQEIRDNTGAHAVSWEAIPGKTSMNPSSTYPMGGGVDVPTTWTQYWAKGTVKAGVTQLAIRSMYFNHPTGSSQAGVISVAGFTVRRKFAGELIVDGDITAKQLNIDAIDATGNISGNAFVGRSFTGGTFTGAVFQTNTAADLGLKISNTGMQVYGPEGGEPVTEIRADGGTTYAVTDPVTGDTLASLDANGNITGTGLNLSGEALFNGVPIVGGTDFEAFSTDYGNGLMDYLPRGMVVRGYRDSRGFSATNKEGEILELSYDNLINRGYRIHVTPFMADVAADTTGVLRIYHTRNGSRPTMSSPILHAQFFRNRTSVTIGAPFGGVFYDLGGSGKVRYLFTFRGEGGQMLFTTASPGGQFRAWVEDIGYAPPETGISRTGARDLEAAAPPAPSAPEPENYTQTWSPTGYRSYDGSSTYSYAEGSNRMYQGNGPYAGTLTSIATFGSGSKGQSITSALSGATVTSVKVKMTFPHWWYGSGGTAQLMLHGVTSLPSTKPTLTYATSKSGIPRGGTVTFSVPSSFWAGIKSGTYDGVGLGNGTSGLTYYGYAKASSVRLEIKYTK